MKTGIREQKAGLDNLVLLLTPPDSLAIALIACLMEMVMRVVIHLMLATTSMLLGHRSRRRKRAPARTGD